MKSYTEHPLLKVPCPQHSNKHSNDTSNFTLKSKLDPSRSLHRKIISYSYRLKNWLLRPWINRLLCKKKIFEQRSSLVNSISYGNRGFSSDIFLKEISGLVGSVDTIVCFGCGLGAEVALVSRVLRPKKIIGFDFFSYPDAWRQVKKNVSADFGVEVEFSQLDLHEIPNEYTNVADLVLSHNVLEHLGHMDKCFSQINILLKNDGLFASQWGPLWYSFSGDHIAAEMGFSEGYKHLELPPEEYLEFYKTHPRNRDDVSKGNPTWLELGLHNFARYDEYMASIKKCFGPIQFLKWQLNPLALKWQSEYPDRWEKILELHPHITSLDLMLGGVSVLSGKTKTKKG